MCTVDHTIKLYVGKKCYMCTFTGPFISGQSVATVALTGVATFIVFTELGALMPVSQIVSSTLINV